jgi:hypothetical protein
MADDGIYALVAAAIKAWEAEYYEEENGLLGPTPLQAKIDKTAKNCYGPTGLPKSASILASPMRRLAMAGSKK